MTEDQPRRHWRIEDAEIAAVATLCGVGVDIGIAITFNEIEEAGRFAGCRNYGDYYVAWLNWKLGEATLMQRRNAKAEVGR